jgi:D-alanyl-D-alanine carboxypeptidase (penicillin-binding protein 5/6)
LIGGIAFMGRRILAILLIALAICIGVMTPVLAFTPAGDSLLQSFSGAAPTPAPSPALVAFTPLPTRAPTPILTVVGTPPVLNVKAAYLLDTDSGHTLADFRGETPHPMASTTKIMTAIIAIQMGNLDQMITVHQDALDEVNNNAGSSAYLHLNEKLRLRELIYGLLLPSGDDAAIAIADGLAGNVATFVNIMNIYAYRLHLFQTHYTNPDGLTYYDAKNRPLPANYSSAYDLVRLAHYAMSIPLFASVVKTTEYKIPATATHHAHIWDTTNAFLAHTYLTPTARTYPGATGIKTGYTLEAGGCLVFSATRHGHHLLGAVLGSATEARRFTDAAKLLDWGFSLPLMVPKV